VAVEEELGLGCRAFGRVEFGATKGLEHHLAGSRRGKNRHIYEKPQGVFYGQR
jgi:hypothetical protein